MTKAQLLVEGQALALPMYEFRNSLYEELHTRPSPKVQSPCYITHLALIRSEESAPIEYDLVSSLCRRFSVNPPPSESSCFYQNFGGFEFRWERHTEFSTYTFIRANDGQGENEFALTLSLIPLLRCRRKSVGWIVVSSARYPKTTWS